MSYQKFLSSRQPAVKLQIAADEFFNPDADHRQEYGTYLRSRILPAAQLLIDREDTEKLQVLRELGWLPGPDELLRYAAQHGKMAAFAWLLELKQETIGFRRKDWKVQP